MSTQHVARHWRETPERYRMEAGKCKKCGAVLFPGRLVCPQCGAREFETLRLSGKGELVTYTIIRVAPTGFGDLTPYAVGIVKLDEGIQVMGQITDCDPEELKIGDRLVTQFRRLNEESKTGMIMYGFKFVPDLGL
ncbi:MAG: transcriptional regulator [Candidatus Aminicenantes bacterium]|nr:transcriptional regulator [Candidatus Aminicenantes bacterium]NIM79449.1 transcriptional regulator [Candidatus Aminicenantes bacterium]NIN18731.1 transcriptional regulator [Candidatus Aminicenantes bacterium]NIN42655.1 transcriptional regulator [Candidatus Aminicenantes bacterium]NIN85394.1 transcriptional regulator [Candidatus Aminicenantes bacterium]